MYKTSEYLKKSNKNNLYIVIGNAGRGRQTLWPKSLDPKVYKSKTAAEKQADKLNAQTSIINNYTHIHWHVQSLENAYEYIASGQQAYTGLQKALNNYA